MTKRWITSSRPHYFGNTLTQRNNRLSALNESAKVSYSSGLFVLLQVHPTFTAGGS